MVTAFAAKMLLATVKFDRQTADPSGCIRWCRLADYLMSPTEPKAAVMQWHSMMQTMRAKLAANKTVIET